MALDIHYFALEEILERLNKHGVNINLKTISHYINYIIGDHKLMFEAIIAKNLNLVDLFYKIDVINFGRAMTYLTLVYMQGCPLENFNYIIWLVSQRLKDMDFSKFMVKDTFIDKMTKLFKRLYKDDILPYDILFPVNKYVDDYEFDPNEDLY